MPAKDWTDIYNKYKGLWVAMKDDEQTVVASGSTLKEAADKAKQQGYNRPILMRVPEELMYFVG